MGFSSYMLACGFQSGSSDEGRESSSRFSVLDFLQDFPLCCPNTEVMEVIFRSPIDTEDSGRERTIHGNQKMEKPWRPPLYRDKSLLAAPCNESLIRSSSSSPPKITTPSVGVIPSDDSIPSQQHNPSPPRSVIKNDKDSSLPLDFIPPNYFCQPRSFTFDAVRKQTKRTDPSVDDGDSLSLTYSKSRSSSSITNLTLEPMDVVCGRGAPTTIHLGNLAFKKTIKTHEMVYLCSTRSEKPKIAMKILKALRAEGVRFVKRERKNNAKNNKDGDAFVWLEIGEQRAYEKVCQSLREGAPQLRRRMMATETKKTKGTNQETCNQQHLRQSNCRPPRRNHQQERQDYNTAFPNEMTRTGSYVSPPRSSSFSSVKTTNVGVYNRIRESNHQNTEGLCRDAHSNKDHLYDIRNHYNGPYYAHLPLHLGGERLFGDRIE